MSGRSSASRAAVRVSRSACALGATLLAAGVIAGCGGSGSKSGSGSGSGSGGTSSGKPVHLTMWQQWGGGHEEAELQKVINLYEKSHPNVTITQTPQNVTEFLTGLGIGRYGVLALILLMYLVLGCLMDAMAMVILTVPIVFPVVTALGFDPIWFGVVIVMTVELGLIHPPVGMNVFVIKSVIKDVNMSTIFVGVLPFVVTDLIRLVILILFPLLATWLPQRMIG